MIRPFRSLFRFFNLPTKMGTDSNGNKYYEKINKEGEKSFCLIIMYLFLGKISRWVVQKSKSSPSEYDPDLIPSSWKSWLSRTRQDPPE